MPFSRRQFRALPAIVRLLPVPRLVDQGSEGESHGLLGTTSKAVYTPVVFTHTFFFFALFTKAWHAEIETVPRFGDI